MDFDFLCWSMSQTFHTITLNMLVLTVDGIYSAHSQHTPLPQNAMLDIISQAQHSGPEQHQEKNKLISTLRVGGGGGEKQQLTVDGIYSAHSQHNPQKVGFYRKKYSF